MRLRVDLLPAHGYADVALVIDVLRATTTACALLEAGARELLLVQTPEEALARRAEGVLLLGERGGQQLPDFDLGNSPLPAGMGGVAGQAVVMTTSNGTGAAHHAAASAGAVLLASLYNAHAAARRALALASAEVAILCAGGEGRAGIEDIYAAGVIAEYLLAMGDFELDDGAKVALTLRRSLSDPLAAIGSGRHAAHLIALGHGEDLRFAARLSESSVVPALLGREGPALRFGAPG